MILDGGEFEEKYNGERKECKTAFSREAELEFFSFVICCRFIIMILTTKTEKEFSLRLAEVSLKLSLNSNKNSFQERLFVEFFAGKIGKKQ
jgi:hypothetical protein